MYYILAPHIQLAGYLKLPFAVCDLKKSKTEFLNREQFKLVYHCDGKHDIDPEKLSASERAFFEHFIRSGFAVECEEGTKLKPYQEYKWYENRFKETVQWSITGGCNYRCKHCFMSAPDARFGHPSKEQCLKLIAEMEECGIKNVSLTGGEPLIRDDLMELVSALTEHHIRITGILTNGALVDEKLLDGLEKNHQHPSFQMSYDGKGRHDWMRGVEGAEEKVLDAFRLLTARGYRTSSAMALHKGNVDVLRDTVLQLRDAGCGALKINVAYPSGEWIRYPEYFLTIEEGYQAYLDYLPQYFADDAPIGIMMEGAFHYEPGAPTYDIITDKNSGASPDRKPVCASLRNMIYIGPEGIVLPCQSMISAPIYDRYPNVFDTSLRDVLTDSVYINDVCSNVSDILLRNPECAVCEYSANCCGGCRAIAVGAEGTDFFAPDMQACRFYKDGWYDRFKAAADAEFEKFKKNRCVERSMARSGKKTGIPAMPEC